MRELVLTAIRALGIVGRGDRIVGAPHIAPGTGLLSLWNGHVSISSWLKGATAGPGGRAAPKGRGSARTIAIWARETIAKMNRALRLVPVFQSLQSGKRRDIFRPRARFVRQFRARGPGIGIKG